MRTQFDINNKVRLRLLNELGAQVGDLAVKHVWSNVYRGVKDEVIKVSNFDLARPCGCRLCNPDAWWMVLCAKCGNKRCPHATNHNLECTNSNAPGQVGSIYA